MITHLVLSGGGINGFASLGALSYLEKHNQIKTSELRVVAGSSVGAIIGLLLVCNYMPNEIYQNIMKEDMTTYFQPSLDNLVDHLGFDTGIRFVNKIKSMLLLKKINPEITFLKLYNLTKRKLIITATCLNTKTVKYFDYIQTPNYKVVDVVRASFSVPILFTTVKGDNNNHYVDGGLLDNFPLHLFVNVPPSSIIAIKFTKSQDFFSGNHLITNSTTTTPITTTPITTTPIINSTNNHRIELNHIGDVIMASISCVLDEIEYLRSMLYKEAYEKSCIMIDIENDSFINAFSFNISNKEKKQLYKMGRKAAKRYIRKKTHRIKDIELKHQTHQHHKTHHHQQQQIIKIPEDIQINISRYVYKNRILEILSKYNKK